MSGIEFGADAAVVHVSAERGIRGQAITIASACYTGLDAVHWGCSQIQADAADIVFAGSTEAPISEFCFAPLVAFGATPKFNDPPHRASRPYELRRDGLVLGEGSSTCILEDLDHAMARGAHDYAGLLVFGSGNEGGYGGKVNASEL